MSSTTTKGLHVAEWTVLRVVKDRAYKFYTERPVDWGKRRALTAEEKIVKHLIREMTWAASR